MNAARRSVLLGILSLFAAGALLATPTNDSIASATAIPGTSATGSGSNVGASLQSGETSPDASGSGNTVWWKWTSPSSGGSATVTVTTFGIGFDAELKIYSGLSSATAFSSLTAVTMTGTPNGNAGTGFKVSFTAAQNTTYFLQFDGNTAGTTENATFDGNVHSGTVRFALYRGTYSEPTVTIPTLDPQPSSGVATGQTMTFNSGASAAGGQTLVYQWYQMDKDGNSVLLTDGTVSTGDFAGEIVSGSATPTLVVNNMPPAGSSGTLFGNMILVVSNADGSGSVTSNSGSMTVFYSPAQIETQPVGASTSTTSNITAGTPATFTVVADGGPLPSFQWRKGGTNLSNGVQTSGSTVGVANTFDSNTNLNTSVLTITSTSSGDNGNYDCVVSNTTTTANSVPSTAITLTVTGKATPVITWATPAAITYGTALSSTQLDATANVAGTFVYSPASGAVLNAGSQTLGVTFTPTDTTDYNGASGSATLTVNKAAATFALNSASFTYTGSAQGPTIVPTPSGATFTAGGTTSAITVGSYTATATASGNYSGSNSSLGWTITKASQAALTVSSSATGTYGAAYTATATGGSGTGAVTWALGTGSTAPGAAISSGGAVTSTGAGTIVISATKASDTNYQSATSANFTITLAKASQSAPVISSASSVTFGSAYTATANSGFGAPAWSLGTGSTAAGAAINSSTGLIGFTGVGTVVIKAAFAGDANHNASSASTDFTVTVGKASLTVTADSMSRSYGAANPAFTATLSGFVNSDTSAVVGGTPSFSTSATPASAAGAYAITPAAGTLSAANYSFGTFTSGTLTVTKAPLTVTANNKLRAVGAANPVFTVSYSGFVNSDTSASLTTQPTATSLATTASPAGTYSIVPSGGVSSNYSFTYVNGTLTVGHFVISDYNNDGHTDVIWENTAGVDRALWYLNGTGIAGFDYLAGVANEWHIAGEADFNGDGQTDLLWEDTLTGDRSVWLMSGTAILDFPYLAWVDPSWHIAAVGDFNGDGKPDILWENAESGGVDRAIWFLDGTNILGFGYLAGIPPEWKIVGTGDFNGDGQTDIVWEDTVTGDRSIWLMTGTSILGFGDLGNVGVAWHIAKVADFDGDGKPDLLWENRTTGDRAIWIMNGTTHTSSVYLAYVDPVWHIAP